MNQIKIGSFIKELRKEKNLTQEKFAEQFGVSRRTVSRWETGNNLPDLDILIEMSDYFNVNLRELLDGEKSVFEGDKELEDTVLRVANYSNEEKRKLMKYMHIFFIVGFIVGIIYIILLLTDNAINFAGGVCQGIMLGMMIIGVIITGSHDAKIRAFKLRLLQKMKN